MTRRPRNILALPALCLLLLGLAVAGPALVYAKGKQPKKTDGHYAVTVAGSFRGAGTAVVGSKVVTINAAVQTDQGAQLTLVCPNLPLNGGHFSGTGACGDATGTVALRVHGRLDGYSGDKHFRAARLLCTYTDAPDPGSPATHAGRIAGTRR